MFLRGRSRAARPSPRVDRTRPAATPVLDGWPSPRPPRGDRATEPGVQPDSSAASYGSARKDPVLKAGLTKILETGSGVPVSDPYQVHDFTVLLAGLPGLLGLAAYLVSRLTPGRLRSLALRTPAEVCRDLAALCSAAVLALYLWGCLPLLFLDRQDIGNACAEESDGVRAVAWEPGPCVSR